MAIGYSPCTRTLGRKRVVVSNNVEAPPPPVAPMKRMCSGRITLNSERSPLEALPHDILIKVLCGVEHEDLKQLFHVSKTIREATLVAKDLHFEYSTPRKNTFAIHSPFDIDGDWFEEIEAPNAPLRKYESRLNGRKVIDFSLALFDSVDEEEN